MVPHGFSAPRFEVSMSPTTGAAVEEQGSSPKFLVMKQYAPHICITAMGLGTFNVWVDWQDGKLDEAKQTRAAVAVPASASITGDAGVMYARGPNGDEIRVRMPESVAIGKFFKPRST